MIFKPRLAAKQGIYVLSSRGTTGAKDGTQEAYSWRRRGGTHTSQDPARQSGECLGYM
jgi:hypothetical protein